LYAQAPAECFTPARCRLLDKTLSKEAAKELLLRPDAEKNRFVIGAGVPAGFKPLPVFAREKDAQEVKNVILAAVRLSEKISAETKEVLARLLE
jgi:hypothetical protein